METKCDRCGKIIMEKGKQRRFYSCIFHSLLCINCSTELFVMELKGEYDELKKEIKKIERRENE